MVEVEVYVPNTYKTMIMNYDYETILRIIGSIHILDTHPHTILWLKTLKNGLLLKI